MQGRPNKPAGGHINGGAPLPRYGVIVDGISRNDGGGGGVDDGTVPPFDLPAISMRLNRVIEIYLTFPPAVVDATNA